MNLPLRSLGTQLLLAVTSLAIALGCSGEEERPPIADGFGTGASGNQADDGGGGEGGVDGTGGRNPLSSCIDVTCPDSNQVCVELGTDASCRCQPGEDCPEVADCASAPCDADAECIDLEDGFRCSCMDGFSGNGFTCMEGDPCEGITCPGLNQECRTKNEIASCQCKNGYAAAAGGDCYDVNECQSQSACDPNANCVNFPGGFRCDCGPGFSTDGNGCSDIDECATNVDSCDPNNGICTNASGGFNCSCRTGTFGDGFFCKGTNHCTGSPCKNGGQCVQTPTSFRCECPLGTTGPTCTNTSSCGLSVVLNSSISPVLADPVLRAAVHNATGIVTGQPITVSDLEGVDELYVDTGLGNLTDLSGLECWTTLKVLSIAGHDVSDLGPVGSLSQLGDLNINCTQVTSLAPLSGLQRLQRLQAARGLTCEGSPQITSLAPLSSLSGLTQLTIVGHAVSDVTPLSVLGRLGYVDLSDNEIAVLTQLGSLKKVHSLYVADNSINSLSVLANLPGLRNLSLAGNGLTSLAGLSAATGLMTLHLTSNSISNASALASLTQLRELYMAFNGVTDLSSISGLRRLTETQLANNQVATLGPLTDDPNFGLQGRLTITANPLECPAEAANVSKLVKRGLDVVGGCP